MKRAIACILALSCLLLCACGAAGSTPEEPQPTEVPAPSPDGNGPLAAPDYPTMAQQPNQEDYLKENGWDVDEKYYEDLRAWREDLAALRDQPEGYADGLEAFFAGCLRQYLAGGEGENRVCSPLNIAMALAMLAEVTEGESRAQLLELLGAEDLDALRATARALWLVSYQDDGVVTSVLANSFWMNDRLGYIPETLQNLASYYYAASFRGEMGSAAYDALLQDWINEQTGGLLKQQASGLHMAPETVLALASAIYFKAPWSDSFYEGNTVRDTFHGPDGELDADYLCRSDETAYYRGERFSSVALPMENGGAMWLVLPEEGVSPEELLNDPEAMTFLLMARKGKWENQSCPMVHLRVPKFDVSSDLDLIPGLQAMGVTDVFDPSVSDFSPLTADVDQIAVSQVKHAARVLIDEDGCDAAAYTVIMMDATAAYWEEPEEVDFIVDRPFLFVITNADGLPLFAGLVQQPTA